MMKLPWFGVTMEEGKYVIVSVNTYDDLEIAKKECIKVNEMIDSQRTSEADGST